jgi:two-component system chemotaxis sensor kinase CheA
VLDGDDVVLILDTRTLVGSPSAAGGWAEVREIHRYRVLVVDDSATSRTLVRNILKTAGYEVLTAIDGEEAFSTLKEQKADLVVSDVEMPKMDGFELTRRIRRDAELERLPVILVTSMGSEEHKSQGAEAGADAYIIKGAFDQDELLQTVARLL